MKILIPVDGSEVSTHALKHAHDLAKRMAKPATLVVLAVDESLFPGVERKIGADAANRLHEENFARMLAPARKALARSKVEHRFVEVVGEVSDGILRIAKKEKPDLLVMGSRGNGAIKGTLIGSVSLKVLNHATVPVTIVR
ncbi:universal stress protein [Luteimonas aestuarii]|uniref:Universal stress protein n=1 Tax=Luteimonas aestuarii TaxID=453837 RepID=A0A4V3ALD3_9GAMM|nr:universal stress protein [Luteimonas aestuarii]TDK21531.1 universal stress protein [Luteimonas aestuarii]